MTKKAYFQIGKYYIRKKLVVWVLILVTFLPLIWIGFIYPYIKENLIPKWFTKTMFLNAAERLDYTGKVKLTADKDGKQVIFTGFLKDGRIEGEGTLYDYEGNILYRGGFEKEMYSGTGTEYYSNGNMKYQGFSS